MKIAFCQMCVPICGRFAPNERGVVGYAKRIWGKYTAKWGVQMAGMNFQTRSKVTVQSASERIHSSSMICPMLPCTTRSAFRSRGVGVLLMRTSLLPR